MATKRPVLCPHCGAQVKKNGYCSACYMPLNVLKKAYNTSNYHYNIGYDKAVARDLSGAIESLNTSLRYNKKNVMTRNLLGLIYYEMGEVVMALSHWVISANYMPNNNIATKYIKELRQDPTRLDNVDQIARKYNAALTYAHNGDYDLGVIQLKAILKENPHFVKGYLLLALLHIRTNNYENARTTLRRVLKIDKTNPLAIRYLHEMGDTDENIFKMRMQSVEDDGLFDEDYMSEVSVTVEGDTVIEGANKKMLKEYKARTRQTTVKTGEFGEVNFARYSGFYVLVGLVLGVLVLSFLIVPYQKKKARGESDKLIESYSEELAAKNSEIQALNLELQSVYSQLETELATGEEGSQMPDYSQIQHGMSVEDVQDMIDNE
ncbi:MAG: tetratricopeptide repeat protein [Lachnospiraceae bacterium]|nr:tetratricopeptide repeat protein [Lachnospiraceae bacterium]